MITPLTWKILILIGFISLVLFTNEKVKSCPVPEIRVRPNDKGYVYADETSDFKLPCNIKRNDPVDDYTVHWKKDGKTIRPVDHKRLSQNTYRWLKIKRVRKDDAGLYSCVVQNKCGGKNSVSIRLYVRELPTLDPNRNLTAVAPRFTVPNRKLQQNQIALPVGNSVKLDCTADGYPPPTVTWYKNGRPFTERRGSAVNFDGRFELPLKDVVPSDTGRYTCNVSNHLGWINNSYVVDVHERIRTKPVVLPMTNVSVIVGENVTLLCKAYSDAMPHFQWLRWFPLPSSSSGNGNETSKLNYKYEVMKQKWQDSSKYLGNKRHEFYEVPFTLVNVTKEDEGKYTCTAGNTIGYAVQNAFIVVQEELVPTRDPKSNVTPVAPRFTVPNPKLQQKLIALPVGNSVKLDCTADGYPPPTVTWYKNGRAFTARRGSAVNFDGRFELSLKDVVPSDTGRYTCNVSNHLGWISNSYDVDVHVQPDSTSVIKRGVGDDKVFATLLDIRRTLGVPCPKGWTRFKSYCYLVSSSIKPWHQAQKYCRGLGGNLVKINSKEENEFVLNLVNKFAPSLKQVWIGLKWDNRVNAFVWYDHSFPTYKKWSPHEPSGKAREPCGHMWTGHAGVSVRASGDWNDLTCWNTGLPCGLVCKRLP